MDIVLRKTGLALQHKRAYPITPEEITRGLAGGYLTKIDTSIYSEVENSEDENQNTSQYYQTREMQAQPIKKRGRGRPKKVRINETD